MTKFAANSFGILAVVVNIVLWHYQGPRATNGLNGAFPFFLVAALLLPALAAWRSKLWLLLLISPVVLVVTAISRMC